jgi:hypothetical protein
MGTMEPEWKPWDQGMGGTIKAVARSRGARCRTQLPPTLASHSHPQIQLLEPPEVASAR